MEDFMATWIGTGAADPGADIKVGNSDLGSIIRDGPANAFSGSDIGSHVNMGDIFFSQNNLVEGKTMRDQVMNYLTAVLPPFPSMISSMAQGIKEYQDGDVLKGVAKLYPSASVRHKIDAYRYATEGDTNKFNQPYMTAPGATHTDKDFKIGEIIGQTIGLRPVRLEEIKDANRLWYQLDKERTNERTLAIAGLTDALVINRKPNIERAVKKFDEFNKKYAGTYPKDLITLDSLDAAYQNRLKQLGLNWRGAQLTEKNADVANQVLGPSHVVKPIAP